MEYVVAVLQKFDKGNYVLPPETVENKEAKQEGKKEAHQEVTDEGLISSNNIESSSRDEVPTKKEGHDGNK
jgi:hypothetical protein